MVTYRCLGFGFDVAVDQQEPALGALVVELYVPFAVDAAVQTRFTLVRWRVAGRPDQFALYANEAVATTTYDGALALAHLVWEVNQRPIASGSEHLLVHAAAAERDGRVVLLCAPSGWGKSTLVGGLLAGGWRYLTDDVAVLDGAGRVAPYPKPLGVARAGRPLLGLGDPDGPAAEFVGADGFVTLGELSADVGTACPPAAVVVPHYVPGVPTTLTPLAPDRAFAALSEQSFNLDACGAPGIERLVDTVAGCGSWSWPTRTCPRPST